MERSEAVRGELHKERLLAATVGWKLEDEEYEELKGRRAELAAAWERQAAVDAELRAEYVDAVLRDHDAKAAAAEARAELADCRAAAKREAELKAWLAAGRAADAERREADRLRRHKELMAFYDTMTPDELQRYLQMRGRVLNEELFKDSPMRQPLAPGPPRVYDLRGDPSTWQLPSPPQDPQSPAPAPAPASKKPVTPRVPNLALRDGRCPVCPFESVCVRSAGGVCTQNFPEDEEGEEQEQPVSPICLPPGFGDPGPSE